MDPVSIVGLASATASLTVLTARVAKDINNILDKYKNVETILQSIEKECTMLGVAFKRITTWLNSNKHRSAEIQQEISDMRTCLAFFEESLYSIDAEISKALPSPTVPNTKFGTRRKIKFLWNEDILKSHLDTVRERRSALSFVIQAFQLSPMESRRQIRQIARATSIRLSRQRDDQSVMSQETTGYETILANSSAYLQARRALSRSTGATRDVQDNTKETRSQLLTETTLLATSDYTGNLYGRDHLNIAEGDFVKILEKRNGSLWLGEAKGKVGLFPIECCDTSVALIGESAADLAKKSSLSSTTHNSGRPPSSLFYLCLSVLGLFAIYSLICAFMPTYTQTTDSRVYTDVEDPLLAAAASGSFETISKLLEPGIRDSVEGALLAAAASGSFELTSKLLEQGVKPSIRDSKLWTPLHLAAANGNNETIALLLKFKDTGWFADDNITPLHLAARYGHTAAVKQITQSYDHDSSRERASFPQAVSKLQASMGKKFDQQFSNFFARKTYSARELAVIFGHAHTALAFPDSQTDYLHALSCACMLGDAQMVETLWNHNAKMWWHQKHGNLGNAVRWFLAPPLHLAIMSGNRATVAFLLEREMNPNDQSSRSLVGKYTNALPPYSAPAHYAAIVGSTELLMALERRGADLTALDHLSRSPLSYAVENLNEAAVELLVTKKYPQRCGLFRHLSNRYLGSGHVWRDNFWKAAGIPSKRIKKALKDLGFAVERWW